jgi:hypothetical protein
VCVCSEWCPGEGLGLQDWRPCVDSYSYNSLDVVMDFITKKNRARDDKSFGNVIPIISFMIRLYLDPRS